MSQQRTINKDFNETAARDARVGLRICLIFAFSFITRFYIVSTNQLSYYHNRG